MLRQADIVQQEFHIVVGASSGICDVYRISALLRNIYRNGTPTGATQFIDDGSKNQRGGRRGQRCRHRGGRQERGGSDTGTSARPTFYSFKTYTVIGPERVIVDSGARSSVFVKKTMEKSIQPLKLEKV